MLTDIEHCYNHQIGSFYSRFLLTYFHLTVDYFQGQGQDHAHFDSDYLVNSDKIYGKRYNCHKIGSQ